jgi:hypothetical protein
LFPDINPQLAFALGVLNPAVSQSCFGGIDIQKYLPP